MESIAIIGQSFKLPHGVEDEPSLWDILENARNVMTAWPQSRVNSDAFLQSDGNANNTVLSHAYVETDDRSTPIDIMNIAVVKGSAFPQGGSHFIRRSLLLYFLERSCFNGPAAAHTARNRVSCFGKLYVNIFGFLCTAR